MSASGVRPAAPDLEGGDEHHAHPNAPLGGRAKPDRSFSGRRSELGALDAVLDRVVADGARVVLVDGPAGIGKTALLRRFVGRHDGLRVLWGTGEDSAPGASFGLIGRMFGSAGGRGRVQPASPTGAPPDGQAVAVGRRVLQVLTGLDRERPVAIVVDDVHRVDLDSQRALLFALRRLSRRRVLTLLTRRSGATDLPDGLVRLAACSATGTTLPVGPMLPAEVQDLAATVGVPGLPPRAADRLCAHTSGNPRHLLALLAEMSPETWDRESALPAPRIFSRTVGRTLHACGGEARRLVEAVSVLGDHAELAIAGELAEVDEPVGALQEACDAGLLTTHRPASDRYVVFPAPLVRAAVYGQLGAARRARLHRVAAQLVDDEAAVLHHRTLADHPPGP